MEFFHESVLLDESIQALNINPDGIYVDGTAGGGGHSAEILKRLKAGKLISIDQDPDAISFLKDKLKNYENSIVVQSNFSNIKQILKDLSIEKVDGVLLDLGVSSFQLDNPERGFSYHDDAPLDMRMSKSGLSAYEVVNDLEEQEITNIIRSYGEEKFAKQISRSIVEFRKKEKISTTLQLAEIIKSALPAKSLRMNKHPAKRTFQAIRIYVNSELKVLEEGLDEIFEVLQKKGRLAVISFHSLEDRIVKNKMALWTKGCTCPKDFPVCICGKKPLAEFYNKKPIMPSELEVWQNRRSRSAKLRVCTKL
ncbi:MAG: 16S rRNA (cytosine(1402)-N(4))-methyltransferase RsmH [Clostridia bacterium]|nr:16S rRNA (cytosine(1402)-N(4))-methyltransferase RsmH [Clostridia bacterium]